MKITINRAPVLTLWATVVAERMGFDADEALSLGRALAGMNAQSKGRMLGLYRPGMDQDGSPAPKVGLGEEFWIEFCGRAVPALKTAEGVRAVKKDEPVDPAKTDTYLQSKFGENLPAARAAMTELAAGFKAAEINDQAYGLYTKFRPEIPKGKAGWGAKGELDLDLIRRLGR